MNTSTEIAYFKKNICFIKFFTHRVLFQAQKIL